MLKKFIHLFVKRRHPWREVQFDELAEIYTSMSMRSLGFGIIGIFVPVYLYQHGVDIRSIFWFFGWVFLIRIPIAVVVAHIIGRIGPKHSIALSTLLFVVFLSMLLSFERLGWPLIALSVGFTVSNGLFFTAYHTDFSKVKDTRHGGKELGWLIIFERIGGALGPLVGGFLATIFAPEVTIVIAMLVLLASLIPLFMSNEPVRLHQHIQFAGFRWKRHMRNNLAVIASHIENSASQFIWPLFVAVVVFKTDTYAKLGSMIALALLISLYSAHMFGKFIDSKRGLQLLNYGVVLNALVHVARPFTLTPASTTILSVVNEPATLSYRMPMLKGYYDSADSEEGYRIVFLSVSEMFAAMGKATYFFSMYGLAAVYDAESVLRWSFLAVAVVSLGIGLQRFPALKKN
jgi:MFS family permease